VQAVPHLCELYRGIYITTEEKGRETLSLGSRKMARYFSGSSTIHIYTQTVQQYSTHLHTNNTENTENGTYITIKKFYRLMCAV
jgi:hypothetical protein